MMFLKPVVVILMMASTACATNMRGVESQLNKHKYGAAIFQFMKDNPGPVGGRHRDYVPTQQAIKYLSVIDADHAAVHNFDMNKIGEVRRFGDALQIPIGSSVHYVKPNRTQPETFPPFSPEFFENINKRLREVAVGYNEVVAAYNKHLAAEASTASAAKQVRAGTAPLDQRAHAWKIKGAEMQARQVKADIARRNEAHRLDRVAKAAGYSGFEDINLVEMLSKTSDEGGFENYLEKVIGCNPKEITAVSYPDGIGTQDFNQCDSEYRHIRILQVGTDHNLYEYKEGYVTVFLFLVRKNPGKFYTEGQKIQGRFHVFTGMRTYQTAAGSTRTVAVFDRVEL